MEIVAIELPHAFGNVAGQLATLRRALEGLPARAPSVPCLVVLPETSLTGYVSQKGDFDLSHFAEPLDGPTVATLSRLAREHAVAICGPWIERDGKRAFNTTVVIDAAGALVARYRKRHPWYPETWATAGAEDIPSFTIGGRACTVCTCFDIHFVRHESGALLDRAELLLFPSAWVEDDPNAFDEVNDARAFDEVNDARAFDEANDVRAFDEANDARAFDEANDARAFDEANDRASLLRGIARAHHVAVVNANWGVGLPAVHGQGRSRIFDASGEDVGAPSSTSGVPVVSFRV